ncbi:hypothetical protein BKI52_38130 [marine bacterium AO1-C]|nr:hypothetical protein BKI52_38130 [marine bacterium AO1-C]
MKIITIISGFLLVFLFSCTKQEEAEPQTQIAMLQVDFTTNQFEGGVEYTLKKEQDFKISSTYQAPGDFGEIQLFYGDQGQKVFDGTIVWAGLGKRVFPESIQAKETFGKIETPLSAPSNAIFEKVMYDEFAYYPEEINYTALWNAIADLEVIATYRKSNPKGKIHLFLYTPGVGVGDPQKWDWLIFVEK